ncbi:MAG: ThuA domain-containing protein [Clostridia bacterium]|nr:ThuA domain-containing protein [Clostridia bacterium]
MIRVTVWNEYVHEREYPAIGAVYPEGIHGCIRRFLGREADVAVTCVTLDMPHQGITRELLAETDVLIWWSHARQEEITDETVRLVREAVHAGMGLIALHSAHFSRIMRDLLGTTMTLHWRHHDREKLWCIAPTHPHAQGAEVPGVGQAAVDLGACENEAAVLTQRLQLVHRQFSHCRKSSLLVHGWRAMPELIPVYDRRNGRFCQAEYERNTIRFGKSLFAGVIRQCCRVGCPVCTGARPSARR